ncbi:MAG: methyltransferase domain-containing protein [Chloroflexota bacterium]
MTNSERGQVVRSAAEVYQDFFVPALFQQWAERVAGFANLRANDGVLDVACGTGVLTRAIAERTGSPENIIGLDINEGMLAVARRTSEAIDWRKGQAEDLPFEDNHFDAVVSQFGLMFFENRTQAITEMVRVLKPKGTLVVAVWDKLDNTAGYAAMAKLLERLFGTDIASSLYAPFNLGDTSQLRPLFDHPLLSDVTIKTLDGTAKFPSIEDWVYTDIKGWTLADQIDDEQYQLLLTEAKKDLARFVIDDATVAFDAPAHIVIAQKKD